MQEGRVPLDPWRTQAYAKSWSSLGKTHPKRNTETWYQISKEAGMETLRLKTFFSSSNFLHYLLLNCFSLSSSQQNFLTVPVWSQCNRRCRNNQVGLPNSQGSSQSKTSLSKKLTDTVSSPPPFACDLHRFSKLEVKAESEDGDENWKADMVSKNKHFCFNGPHCGTACMAACRLCCPTKAASKLKSASVSNTRSSSTSYLDTSCKNLHCVILHWY